MKQKEFGANVRRERIRKELTQAELAERAQLSLRSVQRVEAGQTNSPIGTVIRLRRAIGCPAENILPP